MTLVLRIYFRSSCDQDGLIDTGLCERTIYALVAVLVCALVVFYYSFCAPLGDGLKEALGWISIMTSISAGYIIFGDAEVPASYDGTSKSTMDGKRVLGRIMEQAMVFLLGRLISVINYNSGTSKDRKLHQMMGGLNEYQGWGPETILEIKRLAGTAESKGTFWDGEVRLTPFHYGIDRGAPFEVIETFLKACPQAVSAVDSEGRSSLHVAMGPRHVTCSSFNVIKALLDCYPQAAGTTDELRRTPLHTGMIQGAQPGAIKAVFDAYPGAAECTDREGKTPLQLGMENAASPESIVILLRLDPSLAFLRKQNTTLLHYALLEGVDAGKIEAILKEYPILASIKDGEGRTALQCDMDGASLRLIKAVLASYPPAMELADRAGRTPLHWAMAHRRPLDVISLLLEAGATDSEVITDLQKETCRELFVQQGEKSSDGTVLLRWQDIQLPPSSSKSFTKDAHLSLTCSVCEGGNTPGKLICCVEGCRIKDGSSEIVAFEVAYFEPPGLCKHTEMPGLENHSMILAFPVDDGFTYSLSFTLIGCGKVLKVTDLVVSRTIVSRDRGRKSIVSALKRDRAGRNPLHIGIEAACPPECIEAVLRASPEAGKGLDHNGITPFFLLATHVISEVREPEEINRISEYTKMTQALSDAYPEVAIVENNSGVSPVDSLVTLCSRAKSFDTLVINDIILRLRLAIKACHDGRQLKRLCTLKNKVALRAIFVLFDKSVTPGKVVPSIDLNKEVIQGWTPLEILADLDTDDASEICLQIIVGQHEKLESTVKKNLVNIVCEGNSSVKVSFYSTSPVTEVTMREVADRAKLSNSSKKLKTWGEQYGRFLKKYRIEKEKDPKHISKTCVVVFGTETRTDKKGRKYEAQVALKFMRDASAFQREIEKRAVTKKFEDARKVLFEGNIDIDGNRDGPIPVVVPLLEGFSSLARESLIETKFCDDDLANVSFGVDLQNELREYPSIRLKSTEQDEDEDSRLQFLLVMDCGAGVDLNDVIIHQNIAGIDLLRVLTIALSIAECLSFLNNTCRILHGDVNARNFVSLGVGAGYAVIDMDNAASIKSGEACGKKRTSSGYIPPEQAAVEAFCRRKNREIVEHEVKEAQKKLEAVEAEIDTANLTRAYDEAGRLHMQRLEIKRRLAQLQNPSAPDAVSACTQYDMWSFRVLLFLLCTGKQLFVMDNYEEVGDEELLRIQSWDEKALDDKLQRIGHGWPKSLLRELNRLCKLSVD